MKLIPQQDKIVVLPDPAEEVTSSGIIIPKKAQEQSQTGVVLAVGPGTLEEQMVLMVGQRVMFGRHGGIPVEHDGKDCLVMRQSDVMCVIG